MNLIQRIGQAIGVYKAEATEYQREFRRALGQNIGSKVPIYKDADEQGYITEGYNKNPLVFAIVQWKARKAAAIDFKVVQKDQNGKKLIKDHPVLDLIYNPNPLQGKQEFFEQYHGFKYLTGNSYIWGAGPGEGPNKGRAQEMHVLPAPLVEIVSGANYDPVSGYRVIYGGQSTFDDFPEDQVMHSKYANYYFVNGNQDYGVSPLLAGWATLQKYNSNIDSRKAAFDNMGALGMLIEKDDWAAYTDEQRRRAQAQFDKKYKGKDKKGSIIYTGGEFEYINFGANPVDLQLIEDAQASAVDLCNLFHVDPRLFGIDSTYTNLAEARKISYVDGILPEVKAFCDEFNRWQMPQWGKNLYLEPDTSNIEELQPDLEKMAGWLQNAHYLKETEKREMMGKEPDPELDLYLYPANLIPLSQDPLPPEPPANE